MGIVQYLKETRAELHHVAWPTRLQTIVYTALVIALSVGISLYLGLFDFIFTTSLGKGLEHLPRASTPIEQNQLQQQQIEISTSTPTKNENPTFKIVPNAPSNPPIK